METADTLSQDTSGSSLSTETDESEQNYQQLGRSLELPMEKLRSIGESEEGKLVLDKVVQHLNEKYNEIEDYESALNDFAENMNQHACKEYQ